MTRNDVFESDRREQDLYFTANPKDLVRLPVTRLGFDGLLAAAAKLCVLPVDDDLRKLLIGFIHSLDRKTDHTTIETIAQAMYKSYSNQLTWTIDKEIDAKIRAELEASKPDLKVVAPSETEANH